MPTRSTSRLLLVAGLAVGALVVGLLLPAPHALVTPAGEPTPAPIETRATGELASPFLEAAATHRSDRTHRADPRLSAVPVLLAVVVAAFAALVRGPRRLLRLPSDPLEPPEREVAPVGRRGPPVALAA